MVADVARGLAKQPYKPLPPTSPKRSRTSPTINTSPSTPSAAIWADDNIGFALEPLHRGFIFSTPMQINLVEDGEARRLAL